MKIRFFLLLFVNLYAFIATAQVELKDKVSSATQEYLSSRFMNGVYLFCDDSNIIDQGAKGLYSKEKNTLLEPDQPMPIASATKTITAAAILKLQDKGLLNVNDTVAKHLDNKSAIWSNGIPTWANKVTIHNLLTHRSGLPEYFMAAKIDITKSHEQINKDIANFAASKTLAFEPGFKHDYCNTNYVILGLIIEKISGKKLADFYQEEFFTPLGMKDTKLITLEEAVSHQVNPGSIDYPIRYFVTPTGESKPTFNLAKSEFIMTPYADGGVASTTKDLITWHKALHSGKVLSKDSFDLMITKHYEAPSKEPNVKNYVGYGMFITEMEDDIVIYHHAGNALAIRCESGYIPAKNLYFAVLSNVMNYVPKEMKDKIDVSKPENQLDISHFTKHVFNAIK